MRKNGKTVWIGFALAGVLVLGVSLAIGCGGSATAPAGPEAEAGAAGSAGTTEVAAECPMHPGQPADNCPLCAGMEGMGDADEGASEAGETAAECPMHPGQPADNCPLCAGMEGADEGASASGASDEAMACNCPTEDPDCECGHCSLGEGTCDCSHHG